MNILLASASRFFRQVYNSTTDFGFYPSIFQQPLLRSIAYFLFLNFAISASMAGFQTWSGVTAIRDFVEWGSENLPPITIQNGKRIINQGEPIFRQYFGEEIITFVYTPGDDFDLSQMETPAVILKENQLSIVTDGYGGDWSWGELEQEFAPFIGVLSRPYEWPDWTHRVAWVFFPLALTSHWIFLQIFGLMQALLLMMCSASSAARVGVKLPYRNYFTIAVYSLTPGLILHLFVASAGQGGTLFDFIYLGISAVYTYFATQSCVTTESS